MTDYKLPEVVTVLTGHSSPETAYVVEDYPYGFRLRTSIRYWVETKKGYGQRFVSQTLNPKSNRWNAPKPGIYSLLAGMFLDEVGHVQWSGLGGYSSNEEVEKFGQDFAALVENDSYAGSNYAYILAAKRAASRVKWIVREVSPNDDTPRQTLEEQAAIMHKLTIGELVSPSR